MSILALDTSTQVSSVAVADANCLQAELTMQAKLTHSETLLPHIKQAMAMAHTDKAGLEAIAVSLGPGSFTGLRIGLAAAKALAYAWGISLIGVPSLAALAYHCPVPGVKLVALMDAQKGNAYREIFSWQAGILVTESPIQIKSIDAIVAECDSVDKPVVLLGDVAMKKIKDRFALPTGTAIAPPHLVMPRAANVAMLGLYMLARGETADVMGLEPIYVRRSEAEELWERRHKGEAESGN